MNITDYLAPQQIRQGVIVSSKKRALEIIGKVVAEALQGLLHAENETQEGFCPVDCFNFLFKREKLGATGLSNGVALPHAKLPQHEHCQLDKPLMVFLQLQTPIEYETQDNKEVDLICAVMFPERCCEQYKGLLSDIAARFTDKNLLKQLRAAQSAEEIWQLLQYADNHYESTPTA